MILIIWVNTNPLQKKTRFKNFDYLTLEKNLNNILVKKNSKVDLIKCYFPDKIDQKKY